MSLRIKLFVAFMLIGIIPMAVTGSLLFSKSSEALDLRARAHLESIAQVKAKSVSTYLDDINTKLNSLAHTTDALREEATKRLEALRNARYVQIQNYFDSSVRQITSLAESPLIRDNARNIINAFHEWSPYEKERLATQSEIEAHLFQLNWLESQKKKLRDDPQAVGLEERIAQLEKRVAETTGLLNESKEKLKTIQENITKRTNKAKIKINSFYQTEFGPKFQNKNNGQQSSLLTFPEKMSQQTALFQDFFISSNPNPLGEKDKLLCLDDGSKYDKFHKTLHDSLQHLLEKFGYYDIFLVDPSSGYIVYSVFKELDFATSLHNGPLAESGIGKAFHSALKKAESSSRKFSLTDYQSYSPSYNDPASFVSVPVYGIQGDLVSVLIVQLPLNQLNTLMSERSGLGQTGETYLVGTDFLPRCDTYLDRKSRSVIAAFHSTTSNTIETESVYEALDGEIDVMVTENYLGHTVLSAYRPLEIYGLRWALVADVNVKEAFCPAEDRNDRSSYFYQKYVNLHNYDSIALLDAAGNCFYSSDELEIQKNYFDTSVSSQAFQDALNHNKELDSISFVDFAPYPLLDNTVRSFCIKPIRQAGQIVMYLVVRLHPDRFAEMVQRQENDGLGISGQVYLMGEDYLPRTPLKIPNGNNNEIQLLDTQTAFLNKNAYSLQHSVTKAALAGQTVSQRENNLFGNKAIFSARPVSLFGKQWAFVAEMDYAEAIEEVTSLSSIVLAICAGAFIFILLGVWIMDAQIRQQVIIPIQRVAQTLNRGTQEVQNTSSTLENISQQVAGSAQQQAVSISQTSSAVEEIASMTQQNSANAQRAKEEADRVNMTTVDVQSAMKRMEETMSLIDHSAQETAGIMKTIDEIAFQTNLLSLNAAVEAARAGDAGAGFAVVADEVRNLALRSAESARNTTELIENSVNYAKRGVEDSNKVRESLIAILSTIKEMTEFISEINNGSIEQSNGLVHISEAINDLDSKTQGNALSAHESANASKSLLEQVVLIQQRSEDLLKIIGQGNS